MKALACILLLLTACTTTICAQTYILHGSVTDSATGKGVIGASVFLSNTSIGTATGNDGSFTLHSVPHGRFDLIVSSLGYNVYSQKVTPENIQQGLNIILSPKPNELSAVVVSVYDKAGWAKWGKDFTDFFIGTSAFATQCTIKNTGAIKFRYSEKRQVLDAFADEPLLIENKSLGYLIHYTLKAFSFGYTDRSIYFEGFPLFEEMQGSARDQKRWAAHRKDAYYGSIMHFMRCLFENKLIESGYVVHRFAKKPNLEKQRVKAQYSHYQSMGYSEEEFENSLPPDTLRHYQAVLEQPDENYILDTALLRKDSITYATDDSTTIVLSFNNYLSVVYKNKRIPYEYLTQVLPKPSPKDFLTSQINFINDNKVYVMDNGFYQPANIFFADYWIWSERMSSRLPYDYWP